MGIDCPLLRRRGWLPRDIQHNYATLWNKYFGLPSIRSYRLLNTRTKAPDRKYIALPCRVTGSQEPVWTRCQDVLEIWIFESYCSAHCVRASKGRNSAVLGLSEPKSVINYLKAPKTSSNRRKQAENNLKQPKTHWNCSKSSRTALSRSDTACSGPVSFSFYNATQNVCLPTTNWMQYIWSIVSRGMEALDPRGFARIYF